MRGCWVTFCDHIICNRWDPALVGKRCKPPRRRARFGSVPFIRCVSSPKGLKCFRLDRLGRRRRVSLSPPKTVSMNDYSEDCAGEMTPCMTVPDKCQAHILDHMRCNCSACMNFACQWRKAAKQAFQRQARDPFTPRYKPRRWMYFTGKDRSPQRTMALDKGQADLYRRFPRRSSPAVKHRGSSRTPKVSWWFGHYPPSPESQDESFTSVSPRLNQRKCRKFYSKEPVMIRQDGRNFEDRDGFQEVAMDGTQRESKLKHHHRLLPCDDPVCVDCVRRCSFPNEETLLLRQPRERNDVSYRGMPDALGRAYVNSRNGNGRYGDTSSNQNFWFNYAGNKDSEKYKTVKENYHRQKHSYRDSPFLTRYDNMENEAGVGKLDCKDATCTDFKVCRHTQRDSGAMHDGDKYGNFSYMSRYKDKQQDLDDSFILKSDCSENNIHMDTHGRYRRDDSFIHDKLSCDKSFTDRIDQMTTNTCPSFDKGYLQDQVFQNEDYTSKIQNIAHDFGKGTCLEGKKIKLYNKKRHRKDSARGKHGHVHYDEFAKAGQSPVSYPSTGDKTRCYDDCKRNATPNMSHRKDSTIFTRNKSPKRANHEKNLVNEHLEAGEDPFDHDVRSSEAQIVIDNVANNKALVRTSQATGKHFDSSRNLLRRCKHGKLKSPTNKMQLLGGKDAFAKSRVNSAGLHPRKSDKETSLLPYNPPGLVTPSDTPDLRHCHRYRTNVGSDSQDISKSHDETISPDHTYKKSKDSRHVSFSPIRGRQSFETSRSSRRCSQSPQSLNNSGSHSYKIPSRSRSPKEADSMDSDQPVRNFPRHAASDTNINRSNEYLKEGGHVPFWASEQVMKDKTPQTESKWLDKHISLMEECSKERQDNAKKRMTRIVDKTNELKKSMDYIHLDFGDLEERLDKIRATQRLYLKRAKKAVDSVRNNNNANDLDLYSQNSSTTPPSSRNESDEAKNQVGYRSNFDVRRAVVPSPALTWGGDTYFIEAVRKANSILDIEGGGDHDSCFPDNKSDNEFKSNVDNHSCRLGETRNTCQGSHIHDDINARVGDPRLTMDAKRYRDSEGNSHSSQKSSATKSYKGRSRKDKFYLESDEYIPDVGDKSFVKQQGMGTDYQKQVKHRIMEDNESKEKIRMSSSGSYSYHSKVDTNSNADFFRKSSQMGHGNQKNSWVSLGEEKFKNEEGLVNWKIIRDKMRDRSPQRNIDQRVCRIVGPENLGESYNGNSQGNKFQSSGQENASQEQLISRDKTACKMKKGTNFEDHTVFSHGDSKTCDGDPRRQSKSKFTSDFLQNLDSKTRFVSRISPVSRSKKNLTEDIA